MSDAWFVRFSPSGRLAYGSQVLSVDGVAYAPGTSPRWLSDAELVYTRQPDGALVGWPSGQVLDFAGFNDVDACAARWAGWHAGRDELVTSWGLRLPGCRMPRLSETGLVYAQPAPGDQWRLVGADGDVLVVGAVRDVRVSPAGAVAWSQHVNGRWETRGALPTQPAGAVHVSAGDEFWPVPLDAPWESWVMSHTHTALWLRPWGEDRGYVVAEGVTDFPDARWTEAGWQVAWSDRGVLHTRLVPHDTPRMRLVDAAPGPPVPEPPPAVEPGDPMSTPQSIIDLMVAAGEHADVTHPGLRARDADAWMQIAAGYACAKNANIGRKSTTPSSRISPDTMGCLAPGSPGSLYAVSIIRDNPDGGNEWRPTPLDHGLVRQTFHAVPPIPWETTPAPPVPPEPPPVGDFEARVAALERWRAAVAAASAR